MTYEMTQLRKYANHLVRLYAWRMAHPWLAYVRRTRRRGRSRRIAWTSVPGYYSRWAQAHPVSRRASYARWRAKNKERMRAYDAARYRRDRDRIIAANAEWHRKNRARVRLRQATRIQNIRGNGGRHTSAEWLAKCALLGHVCVYCGEARPLARDHKIPVARGGSSDITIIVPACGSCNSAKKDQTAAEFLARRRAA